MVRDARQLFCDNEHGFGEMTFPEDGVFDWEKYPSATAVRRAAHAAGWRRHQGVDYCPSCVEIDKEHAAERRADRKAAA